MKDLAVIFDAFGTLIKIKAGAHPYRDIFKLGIEQGRRPSANDAEILLSKPLDLRDAAEFFGISVPIAEMIRLESKLNNELLGLQAHEDGLTAVARLQAAGVTVGICSNLAKPYAAAIERLYPSVINHSYSFEIGAVKPNVKLYEHAASVLRLPPGRIWMIGDSKTNDGDGPRNFGMNGFHLDRSGNGDYKTLTDFTEDFLIAFHAS